MEYQYQKTPFVAKHFLELDVASGTVAFVIIAALGLTSNDASVRWLKAGWKKLQTLAYPLFFITALHVAFASRFDAFYMVLISVLVLARTLSYVAEPESPVAVRSTGKRKNKRYLCVPCGYVYDPAVGDVDGGIAPGTEFEDIPYSWVCPVCGVSKKDFVEISEDAIVKNVAEGAVSSIRNLNATTVELVVEADRDVAYEIGQYAVLSLTDKDGKFSRCYSIVSKNGRKLTFGIRVKDGRGSSVLKKTKAGDKVGIVSVMGEFLLRDTKHPKVFIATGTGLSGVFPLVSAAKGSKTLLLGDRKKEDLYYQAELSKISGLERRTFLSQEKTPDTEFGRLDVDAVEFDRDSEFYVCGNPEMVKSAEESLRKRGFARIYSEKF